MNFVLYLYPTYIHTCMHTYIHTYRDDDTEGDELIGLRLEFMMARCCLIFYMTVWCLTLIGKPLGKSTKGKAKA